MITLIIFFSFLISFSFSLLKLALFLFLLWLVIALSFYLFSCSLYQALLQQYCGCSFLFISAICPIILYYHHLSLLPGQASRLNYLLDFVQLSFYYSHPLLLSLPYLFRLQYLPCFQLSVVIGVGSLTGLNFSSLSLMALVIYILGFQASIDSREVQLSPLLYIPSPSYRQSRLATRHYIYLSRGSTLPIQPCSLLYYNLKRRIIHISLFYDIRFLYIRTSSI